MLAVVVKKQGLGAALALVVAGADANRVDPAPVAFHLRVHLGVAIDLRSRGLEDWHAQALDEVEQVDGAQHARLGGLDRASSRYTPPLMRMPWRAAAARPLTIVTGIEITSAQGQAGDDQQNEGFVDPGEPVPAHEQWRQNRNR